MKDGIESRFLAHLETEKKLVDSLAKMMKAYLSLMDHCEGLNKKIKELTNGA